MSVFRHKPEKLAEMKEAQMWRVPILTKESRGEQGDIGSSYGTRGYSRPLPLFYMSDYSVLGLKVHPLEEALRIIGERGFVLEEEVCGPEVVLDDPSFLVDVMDALRAEGVSYEIADLVEGVYQG